MRVPPDLTLETAIDHLRVEPLTLRDASAFFRLVDANRDHLRRFGDYADLASSTLEDVTQYFTDPPDDNLRMGIRVSGRSRPSAGSAS